MLPLTLSGGGSLVWVLWRSDLCGLVGMVGQSPVSFRSESSSGFPPLLLA